MKTLADKIANARAGAGAWATGHMNYRPNGCVHTVTTQNGATVLAIVWGRTEPV